MCLFSSSTKWCRYSLTASARYFLLYRRCTSPCTSGRSPCNTRLKKLPTSHLRQQSLLVLGQLVPHRGAIQRGQLGAHHPLVAGQRFGPLERRVDVPGLAHRCLAESSCQRGRAFHLLSPSRSRCCQNRLFSESLVVRARRCSSVKIERRSGDSRLVEVRTPAGVRSRTCGGSGSMHAAIGCHRLDPGGMRHVRISQLGRLSSVR